MEQPQILQIVDKTERNETQGKPVANCVLLTNNKKEDEINF